MSDLYKSILNKLTLSQSITIRQQLIECKEDYIDLRIAAELLGGQHVYDILISPGPTGSRIKRKYIVTITKNRNIIYDKWVTIGAITTCIFRNLMDDVLACVGRDHTQKIIPALDRLSTQVENLTEALHYAPGGPAYAAARAEFERLADNGAQ